jgi:hypothetical protein
MNIVTVINYAALGFMLTSLAWAAFLWVRESHRARFSKARDIEIIILDED